MLRNITTLGICYTTSNILVYINSVNVPLFKIVKEEQGKGSRYDSMWGLMGLCR